MAKKTCGEFGGLTNEGNPCKRLSVRGGRCRWHDAPAVQLDRAKQAIFLARLADTGNVTAAARTSGVSRDTHYDWMRTDPEYPAHVATALEEAADIMEAEARRRAIVGVSRNVYYQGKKIDAVTDYSDVLLMFLLKGAKPEKYRERWEGKLGGVEGGSAIPVAIYLPHNERDTPPAIGSHPALPPGDTGED